MSNETSPNVGTNGYKPFVPTWDILKQWLADKPNSAIVGTTCMKQSCPIATWCVVEGGWSSPFVNSNNIMEFTEGSNDVYYKTLSDKRIRDLIFAVDSQGSGRQITAGAIKELMKFIDDGSLWDRINANS